MSLFVFNTTGAPITMAVTAVVVPASSSPGERGPAVNVTSEMRANLTADPVRGKTGGLSAANYATIAAQTDLEFEWSGTAEYLTPGLPVTGAIVANKLFIFEAPVAPDVNAVHAGLDADSANVAATFDFASAGGGDLDTIVQAVTAGAAGNSLTVRVVGDSAAAAGVTISEVGTAVVIHYESGVSTRADIETAITASATLISVLTPGADAGALVSPGDNIPATNLTGGIDGNAFTDAFTDPDVPRVLTVTFDALWDGGNVTVVGVNQFDEAVSEVFVSNPGGDAVGEKVFKSVTSASKGTVGAASVPATIGVGGTIGIDGRVSSDFGVLFADDVVEPVTVDDVNGSFSPNSAPDGSIVYKLLVNVNCL